MDVLIELERFIRRLESSVDSWSFWIEFCTALVVLGLLLEYAHDVWELMWRRPFNWGRAKKLFGGILITVGVAGELLFGMKLSAVEINLREANEEVIGFLNREAGEARKVAAVAEQKAAEAIETAEHEKLERVKIEEKLAPRDLSAEQQEYIVSVLKKFAGRTVNIFTPYAGEDRVAHIGNQIEAVFRRSGWLIRGSHAERNGTTIAPQEFREIMVGVDFGADLPTLIASWTVASSLREARLGVVDLPDVFISPPPFLPCVQVIVGRK